MHVKICGITNVEDARYCIEAGADWIGLNLVSGPRRIEPAQAKAILSELAEPARAVLLLSVEPIAALEATLAELAPYGIRRIQTYGSLSTAIIGKLLAMHFEVIQVQPVGQAKELDLLGQFLSACGADRPNYLLFDGQSPGQMGGTGRQANWAAIARCREAGGSRNWPPVLLAGGLNPENVAQAIDQVAPFGVDVSSGVEAAPGRKDHRKVKRFIQLSRR